MARTDTQFKKRSTPWNKGLVGVQVSTRKGKKLKPLTDEHKVKISEKMKSGVEHNGWKGGKPTCGECGILLSNYSNKKCVLHSIRRGEEHPSWIKDRTKLAVLSNGEEYRNSPMSREWSMTVKNRDHWKCLINNKDCEGKVVAHHILSWKDYQELRYEVNNGITLCHFHHPRKIEDEMKLSPFFKDLVELKAH